MEIIVSNHAEKRLKERAGLNKKASIRMAQKAFDNGITMSGDKGSFNKWLAYIAHKGYDPKIYSNIRIYGEFMYIFNGDTLVTVLDVPQQRKKTALAKQKTKKA